MVAATSMTEPEFWKLNTGNVLRVAGASSRLRPERPASGTSLQRQQGILRPKCRKRGGLVCTILLGPQTNSHPFADGKPELSGLWEGGLGSKGGVEEDDESRTILQAQQATYLLVLREGGVQAWG